MGRDKAYMCHSPHYMWFESPLPFPLSSLCTDISKKKNSQAIAYFFFFFFEKNLYNLFKINFLPLKIFFSF